MIFLEHAWTFVMDILCEQLGKDKKQKKKIEKYRGLHNSIKDEFLRDYLKRCEFKYKVKVAMEMAEAHGGLSPKNSEMVAEWKAEIKNLEKKLGLKKEDKASAGGSHPQKSSSAGGAKGGSKKDHKNDKKEENIHFERDMATYRWTPELIQTVHLRRRHSVYQFFPS
jgi:hypothetical protein